MGAEQLKFDQWCILEIMGHQRFAGRVTEQTLGGASFLRIDIPETPSQPAFTKFFGASSVYAITPTTEELAKGVAASIRNTPIEVYDLPEAMQAKLRAPALTGPSGYDDDGLDDDDQGDDDDGLY